MNDEYEVSTEEFEKPRNLGALWEKRSARDGSIVLLGRVDVMGERTEIVILPNKQKEAANQPDFLIYEQKKFEKQ